MRSGKQRDQAELALRSLRTRGGKARIPDRAEEECRRRNRLEEGHRLEQHREDDADGRENGDSRCSEQCAEDDALDIVAGTRPDMDTGKTKDRSANCQHDRDKPPIVICPCRILVPLDGDRDHVILTVGRERNTLAERSGRSSAKVCGRLAFSSLAEFVQAARYAADHAQAQDFGWQ